MCLVYDCFFNDVGWSVFNLKEYSNDVLTNDTNGQKLKATE